MAWRSLLPDIERGTESGWVRQQDTVDLRDIARTMV
jgi:hypothetical protein